MKYKSNTLHGFFTAITFVMTLLVGYSNAQTIIYPAHDAFVSEISPSINEGANQELRIKKSYSGNDDQMVYLSFDLTGLSLNYGQVILQLTSLDTSVVSILLKNADTLIDEMTVTWNAQPINTEHLLYGGIKKEAIIEYDITNFVNEKIALAQDVTLQLYSNLRTMDSQVLGSKEHPNANYRPKLLLYSNTSVDMALFEMKDTLATTIDYGNFASTILKSKDGYSDSLDQYGGLISCGFSFNATGYFRTEKRDSIWYFVDPDGNRFYTVAFNSVEHGGGLNLPNDLKDIGVNTLGCWSDESILNIPYCPRLNILQTFKNIRPDVTATWNAFVLPVFEADFASYLSANMASWVAPYLNDPWVVGYFMDNELKFSDTQLEKSLLLDTSNAQFQHANAYMVATYGTGYSTTQVTNADEMVYLADVAEKYYSVASTALRAADSIHLLLGTRINGNSRYRVPVLEAAGKYLDVLSINYYREWEPQDSAFILWEDNTDIPWFTSEFYTKAADSGWPNLNGAGWEVPTQEERSIFFENWVVRSLKDPACDTLLGISNKNIKSQSIIYPNPIKNDRLTIEFRSPYLGQMLIEVSDLYGKKIYSKEKVISNNRLTIKLGDLSPGVYFLNAYDQKGLVNSNKFIKN